MPLPLGVSQPVICELGQSAQVAGDEAARQSLHSCIREYSVISEAVHVHLVRHAAARTISHKSKRVRPPRACRGGHVEAPAGGCAQRGQQRPAAASQGRHRHALPQADAGGGCGQANPPTRPAPPPTCVYWRSAPCCTCFPCCWLCCVCGQGWASCGALLQHRLRSRGKQVLLTAGPCPAAGAAGGRQGGAAAGTGARPAAGACLCCAC